MAKHTFALTKLNKHAGKENGRVAIASRPLLELS